MALCLNETINIFGVQLLVLKKLVLYILFGNSNSQVRDAAKLAIMETYGHEGEIKGGWTLQERKSSCWSKKQNKTKQNFIKRDAVENFSSMVFSVHKNKNCDTKNQWMKICCHTLLRSS